jgi:GTPase KRas protein
MLSGLSLNDISIISVIALPITLDDINKIAPHLTFARLMDRSDDPEISQAIPEQLSESTLKSAMIARVQPVRRNLSILRLFIPSSDPVASRRGSGKITRTPDRLRSSDGSGKMPLYKLVVLGDPGVGRTALVSSVCQSPFSLFTLSETHICQFCSGQFIERYDPTIYDSYRKQITLDGQPAMVDVLDTTGQEEYIALRDQWVQDAEAFLVVYSITSRSSFERVPNFCRQIQRVKYSPEDHTEYSEPSGPWDLPHSNFVDRIMLVGNNSEQIDKREVSMQEGLALAKEIGCHALETSAKNGINVEQAFYDAVRSIRKHEQQNSRPQTR